MTATTLRQVEGAPASYPELPDAFLASTQTLPAGFYDWIWQRIEGYIAHRWPARSVVWTVEGPGEWAPPLSPATITTTEIWRNEAWTAETLSPSPLGGLELPGCGPYRLKGTAGDDSTPPAAVMRAAHRLADYCLSAPVPNLDPGGPNLPDLWATTINRREAGEHGGELTVERPMNWVARALEHSGAADLLRPYRRAP